MILSEKFQKLSIFENHNNSEKFIDRTFSAEHHTNAKRINVEFIIFVLVNHFNERIFLY